MNFFHRLTQSIIKPQLTKFERKYQYDMGYAHTVLDAGIPEFRDFASVFKLASQRRNVPFGPWFAAKWVATASEDCGSCLQLLIQMGREAGLSTSLMKAISQGDLNAMPKDISLAFQWADATINGNKAVNESSLRNEILQCWGPRGLISLTLAMAGARNFPLIKRALGQDQQCKLLEWDQIS